MVWVRLDDEFPAHPKVSQLTDREFRVHIRTLCWAAKYKTYGNLPAGVFNDVAGLSRALGKKFLELGLWDDTDDPKVYVIHDALKYLPKDETNAQRQKEWRERNGQRNGSRNGEITDEVTPPETPDVTVPTRAGESRTHKPDPDPEVPLPSEEVSEAKASSGEESEDDPIDEQTIRRVYDSWRNCFAKTRSNYNRISPQRRAVIKRRLKKWAAADLIRAMEACVAYEQPRWWLTHNDLDTVLRNDGRIEHFLELADNPPAADELEPRRNGKGLSSADIRARATKEAS